MSANVALSDTFDQWRVKTNELLVMTQVDGSSNFLKLTNSTNSTSNTTGSVITAGGVGVAKSVTIGENLTVHGNIHANGNISADGTLTLGSDNTDNINFNADISSNVVPNTDSTHNLGNTTFYWANAFINTIDVQQESDAGKPGIKVTGADADAKLVEILGSQTTNDILYVNAASLTTGSAFVINQDLNDATTRTLAKIIQDNTAATGATGLSIQMDAGRGLFIDTNLTTGGYSFEIDASQTTTNTAKITSAATTGTVLEVVGSGVLTGSAVSVVADSATTGSGIDVSMDGLTSGKLLNLTSTAAFTGSIIDITADSTTSGKGINISMDGLTTGEAITVASTGTHSGNLVSILSDGDATGTSLYVRNDSTTATTPVIQFANSSATVFRVDVSGDVNVGGHVGSSNTGALLIPVGDTGERPGSPSTGQVRFNSDESLMEVYNGTDWTGVGSGSGGAANTIEIRVDGTIASRADATTNTVTVTIIANTTLTGTYGNRITISGETDDSTADSFVIDTTCLVQANSSSVVSTDVGSYERLGNDTLGSGSEQVTVGTPTYANSTAYNIPVTFKNTSGSAKALQYHIVTKVYGGNTALANVVQTVS